MLSLHHEDKNSPAASMDRNTSLSLPSSHITFRSQARAAGGASVLAKNDGMYVLTQ
jgi:hypothetical protein